MYRVIRVGIWYELLILEDLDDAPCGREDRFWIFDRDWLLHDIRFRQEQADLGHTTRVFRRISQEDLSPYLVGLAGGIGFVDPPADDFPTVMSAWRWLRLKQAECADQDVQYFSERLQDDPGNKFFRMMVNDRRAEAEAIRRRLA